MAVHTKNATIDDVVRVSGYSRSTVFRYLAGRDVRTSAKAAIRSAIASLGYKHQALAPADTAGVVISVSPVFDRFRGYAEIIEGIIHRSAEAGMRVRLDRVANSDKSGNGVIIVGKSMRDEEEEIAFLQSRAIPFVLVNRVFEDSSISYASVDMRGASREAVSHLIEQGHRRIGIWADARNARVARDKLAGYMDAFSQAGIAPETALITAPEAGDLVTVVARSLASPVRPSAWFALDDESAMKVIKTARDSGLRVPEDLAVIGMNNIESAEYLNPSLSSVHVPFREAGMSAVDVLRRLLEHPSESAVKIVLKHRLIVRESSQGWLGAFAGGRS